MVHANRYEHKKRRGDGPDRVSKAARHAVAAAAAVDDDDNSRDPAVNTSAKADEHSAEVHRLIKMYTKSLLQSMLEKAGQAISGNVPELARRLVTRSSMSVVVIQTLMK